ALAGAGMISWYHLVAWRNLGSRAHVVAVCDPDLDHARRRAGEFGIAKVYPDAAALLANEALDALDVASPRETHADWVAAAEERLMIAEVLIHHLDVMRFLCGSLRVAGARAARTLPEVRGETVATIFLETATGAPVVVTGTMAAPGYPPRAPDRLEIVGTRAS